MKFFAVVALGFCAIAAVSAVPAVVNTGHSAQFRSQDSAGNYAFGYNEDHATGGTFRRETGRPGSAEGSYGLRVADGRVRVVNYVADGHGFRANIQTNEPGVEDQDPASVLINKAAAIVAPYIQAPVVSHAAPLAIQQSYEAPVVQKYEAAPIIEQAPIVQRYEQAPIVQQYEQAPIVEQRYAAGPVVQQYEAPVVQKYESAPIIEQAPIVQRYEQAPIVEQRYDAGPAYGVAGPAYGPVAPAYGVAGPAYASAPLVSSYTTKTYAAPAPILSAPAVYDAPVAHAAYATKGAPAYGISSAALLGVKSPLASPVFAAKSLGYPNLIKKK